MVTQYFQPEGGAGAARVGYLAEYLRRQGHEVSVIAPLPNYPKGEIHPDYRGRVRVKERLSSGIEVTRLWLLARGGRGLGGKLAAQLTFALMSSVAILFQKRPDVVFVSSPPPFIGLAGIVAKLRWRGVKFVLDIRDIWPDVAVDLGVIRNRAIIGIARRGMRLLFRVADLLIPVTGGFRDYIAEAYGVSCDKQAVITNGVDDAWFDQPVSGDGVRSTLGLEERVVILFLGTLGYAQGGEILLEAANALREEEAIHFLVVGDGPARPGLEEEARRLGLENVTFAGYQPPNAIPEYIAAADVGLSMLRACDQNRRTLQVKLLEYLAMAKPVVLCAEGESAKLIRLAHGGYVCPPGDLPCLVERLRELSRDAGRRARFGESGRAYVRAHFRRSTQAERLIEKLEALIARA